MGARAHDPGTRCGHRAAHGCELGDSLADVVAHTAHQLHLAGVQLQLKRPGDGGGALDDSRRGVGLPARERVDEEQLLLDADRERPL
jgi:hypothetical protein